MSALKHPTTDHARRARRCGCRETHPAGGSYAAAVDIRLRPLARSDIPAWADLLAAIERVDRTGEHYDAADLTQELANPEVEVGKDFVGAFDADGQLVGYYSILPRGAADGHYSVDTQGSVLPVGRAQGIGTLLVTAMVQGAAAYVQTAEFEADLAATGRREAYVGKVGTLRGHRGNGLATALLGHALHAYR